MNKRTFIIILSIMVVGIVVFAAIGVRNVIKINEADKTLETIKTTDKTGDKVPSGTLTDEISKVYKEINEYKEKVDKIVENTSHDDVKNIKDSVKELKNIQKDIKDNHSNFSHHNAGLELNEQIEKSITALENQLFLYGELEKEN